MINIEIKSSDWNTLHLSTKWNWNPTNNILTEMIESGLVQDTVLHLGQEIRIDGNVLFETNIRGGN